MVHVTFPVTGIDIGCGMDQETLRGFSSRPSRGNRPARARVWGLAVAHGIMETHDGSVTVYSQPGKGTVFHLYPDDRL
jgi:sensor histidine kinase YesM